MRTSSYSQSSSIETIMFASRSLLPLWCLLMILAMLFPDARTINDTSKVVNVSSIFTKPLKSIYYDLTTRQQFEIEIDDATRLPNKPMNFISRSRNCQCQILSCGCCTGINIEYFNFDKKPCANVTLKPEDLSINVDMSVDGVPYLHTKVSGSDPPPLCFPLWFFPIINFCGRFYNLGIHNGNLHACIDFETRIGQWPIFILHFRCFRIGLNGTGWVDNSTAVENNFKPSADLLDDIVLINHTQLISTQPSEVYDEVTFEPDNIEINSTIIMIEDSQIGTLKD